LLGVVHIVGLVSRRKRGLTQGRLAGRREKRGK
jgi:hypothetical protein